MQNRDDVDGSQRPQTADAPGAKSPAGEQDVGGHMGPAGDPVEGDEGAIESDLDDLQNSPAKE